MDTHRTRIPDGLIEGQHDTRDDINVIDKPWNLKEDEWHSWVRVYFLIFGAAASSLVVIVFLWHLLTPFHWLSSSGLDKISNFALSVIVGLVTSGLTAYFFSKKR